MPYCGVTQFARAGTDNSAFGMHELFSGSKLHSVDAFQLVAQAEAAQWEAATPAIHTVITSLSQVNAASSQLAAAAAAGWVTARAVTPDFDVFARIRQLIKAAVQAPVPAPMWQGLLLNPESPVDVDSISATVESVLATVEQYGIDALELGNYRADQVSGEHLAAILRVTSSARDELPEWGIALNVATEALLLAGSDPDDALFGMI